MEPGYFNIRLLSETEVRRVDKGYWAELKGSSLEPILRAGQPRIINNLEQHLAARPDSKATQDILKDKVMSNLTCPLRAGNRPIGFASSVRASPTPTSQATSTHF